MGANPFRVHHEQTPHMPNLTLSNHFISKQHSLKAPLARWGLIGVHCVHPLYTPLRNFAPDRALMRFSTGLARAFLSHPPRGALVIRAHMCKEFT